MARVLARAILTVASLLVASATASAQAWVAPARVGGVNVYFQNVNHTGHLLTDGSNLPGFDSQSRGLLIEIDYAFTDRFSITAGVPYVGSKYLGPLPSFFRVEIDDYSCWNHSFQDFGFTARYNLFNDAFALTPSVGYGVPTHDYPFVWEAVVGRNLNELRLAIDSGLRLDAISPRLSVSGRYSYAFVEEVLDLPNDLSNAYLNVGWLFTQRLAESLDLLWQHSHGGLTSDDFFVGVPDEVFIQFDRILKDNSFHIGGSVAYSFTRIGLFANYIAFVNGTDTHLGRSVTVGVSYPFQF